jgi:hypothetical protein
MAHPKDARANDMSVISNMRVRVNSMPREAVKSIFEIAGVILLFLTFVVGAGVLLIGNKINERQAERLRQFDKDLTEAKAALTKQQERAIEAERRLLELRESISWRTPDRALIPQLAAALQRFPRQRCAIVTDPADPERAFVLSWIVSLLATATWGLEAAPPSFRSELTFMATNIVLWVSPTAPEVVLEAARALVPAMERGGLPAVVLQSGWGPQPDVAPPELIRVVIFKKGPRMTVTGNMITFEGLPTTQFFGSGPPR